MYDVRGYLFYIHTENFLALCSYLFIRFCRPSTMMMMMSSRLLSFIPKGYVVRQRSYASNPHIILEHFRKLGNIIRKHNIKPQAIANMDEKGFVMGYSKRTKVLMRRGRKNHCVKQDENREPIMAVEALYWAQLKTYLLPTGSRYSEAS